MPIPAQNDFFRPFLEQLGGGKTLTRAEIREALIVRFSINEAEQAHKSGHQTTLTSRIAWCDVHLVKAGLMAKHRDPASPMNDTFTITVRGVEELRDGPHELSVAYLRRFYDGRVHRGAGSLEGGSEAEQTLFELFEQLPKSFTVMHSVKWFDYDGSGTVGEIDFLVAHPEYGVLVLEVKGGLVQIIDNRWYTVTRNNAIYDIQDPCAQAERNRRALHTWLKHHHTTRHLNFALFPAVALPESRVRDDIRPDCTNAIFIDESHLDDLEGRIMEIFAYWQARADSRNQRMDGAMAIEGLRALMIPSRKFHRTLSEQFASENRKIETLTQEQYEVLSILRYKQQAAIIGGAGTGKTLLAMHKAAQLANEGQRVLFVCFNKPLSEWIASTIGDKVEVFTFHGYVSDLMKRTGAAYNRQGNFFDLAGEYLLDITDSYIDEEREGLFYDAVIVDEAQDFQETWWYGLRDSLINPDKGVLYVFFDDQQRIYTQMAEMPIALDTFYLSKNLRNTQHIHESLRPYANSDDAKCVGPIGRPVEIIPAANDKKERQALRKVLHELVNEQGIPLQDIVVMTASSDRYSQWQSGMSIGNFTLTREQEKRGKAGLVYVTTIHKFKGLESAVVILTELDHIAENRHIKDSRPLIYVALSRARNHVVVIGELPKPNN